MSSDIHLQDVVEFSGLFLQDIEGSARPAWEEDLALSVDGGSPEKPAAKEVRRLACSWPLRTPGRCSVAVGDGPDLRFFFSLSLSPPGGSSFSR